MASIRVAAAALLASSTFASVLKFPRQTAGEVVDTEALQATITQEALKKRAEELFEIAKASEEEFGHPTRAIGTAGKFATPLIGTDSRLTPSQAIKGPWTTSTARSVLLETTTLCRISHSPQHQGRY
jgi:hypothetical protein